MTSATASVAPGATEALDLLRLQHALVMRLAAIADIDAAIEGILDTVLQISPIDCGGVYMFDRDTGELVLVAHRGLPPTFIAGAMRYTPDLPQVGVVQRGTPIYTRLRDLRDAIGANEGEDDGLRALAVIPVMHEGRAIGALNAATHTADELPPHVRTALETMAAEIGAALVRITARRDAAEEQQNLATFFASTHDLLFVVSEAGLILHHNDASLRSLGYAPGELVGRPLLDVHPPELREHAAAVMARIIAHGGGTCDLPLLTRGGERVPAETQVAMGRWRGRPAIYGLTRDLTIRKRLEARLLQSSKMEALGTLASGVAHDFNNILGTIGVLAESARFAAASGEDPDADLQGITDMVTRGADVIHRIMRFSGRSRPASAHELDVAQVAAATGALLRRMLPSHVRLEVEIGDAPCVARVHEGELTAALMNLATNARDAMPDGGVLGLRVARATFDGTEAAGPLRAGAFVQITVSDTGVGMDDATQAHLFEPFFTTKGEGRGTGLGLVGVYNLVRDAGGDVRCTSAPGRGTTFELTLPVADEPAARG